MLEILNLKFQNLILAALAKPEGEVQEYFVDTVAGVIVRCSDTAGKSEAEHESGVVGL